MKHPGQFLPDIFHSGTRHPQEIAGYFGEISEVAMEHAAQLKERSYTNRPCADPENREQKYSVLDFPDPKGPPSGGKKEPGAIQKIGHIPA